MNIPGYELDALYSLYNSTGGVDWNWRPVDTAGSKWVFTETANPCTEHWQGITCFISDDQYHIERLELLEYGLDGYIPPAIANLTQLEVLYLDRNFIGGVVPDTIGALTSLVELSLQTNFLTGQLPESLASLTALVNLDLAVNEMIGPFPEAVLSLTSLQSLWLNGNHFHGTIPASIGSLEYLAVLGLYNNEFAGTIPAEVGDLSALERLYLYYNDISGTLPAELSQLSQLQELKVGNNLLHGTVPSVLGQLGSLTVLDLHINGFSSSLPGELGNLALLQQLRLFDNRFTGTIPSFLAQLSALQFLDLSANVFHGPIPAFLGQLSNMDTLLLYGNKFTGTVPSNLGDLSNLRILDLDGNALSGTVPDTLQSLEHLAILSLWNNAFSGQLPEWFCGMQNLTILYLENNLFSGPALTCLDPLPKLQYAAFAHNLLTGPVPVMNCSLSRLRTVWFQYNQLTGTLPAYADTCDVKQFALSNNYLTGTLPPSLGNPAIVQAIALLKNHFTGTIPSYLGAYRRLQVLSLHSNRLSGCIPTSLSNLTQLVEIYLFNNRLGCNLDGVFNPVTQLILADISINNNAITGTLPPELFALPSLASFVAHSNCFSGTLPEQTLCANRRIVSLILDGLHTAPHCRTLLLPPLLESYVSPSAFHGTIPECLFQIPLLSTLHLSGIGLSGAIPSLHNISVNLVDLILSHNALSGTIPTSIQAHKWHTLDLSFNRLTGTLRPNFGVNFDISTLRVGNISYNVTATTLALENNRLSGRIPSALDSLQTVSILGSNLFYCRIDKSDVPRQDPDRDTYQCGSNAFDAPFYAVLIMLGLTGITLLLCYRYRSLIQSTRALVETWQQSLAELPAATQTLAALDVVTQCALLSTALIVVVLAPWYAAASTQFSTYTHAYAWSVSAAFLSGVTPLVVEFVLYCALMVVMLVFAALCVSKLRAHSRISTEESVTGGGAVEDGDREATISSPRQSADTEATVSFTDTTITTAAASAVPRWQRVLVYSAFVAVNVFVTAGVNAGFVAVALTQPSGVLFLAQLLLSLFKLSWNNVCVPELIHQATVFVSRSQRSTNFVTVQICITLFNNIAIPCLVTAVLSPSCFYSIFDPPDAVQSTFAARNCIVEPTLIVCDYSSAIDATQFVPYYILGTSYSPPFSYDFQCSSSFITYYAPAFVYLGIAAGALTPLAKWGAVSLQRRARKDGPLHRMLSRVMPRILQPVVAIADEEGHGERDASEDGGSTQTAASIIVKRSRTNPLFDANSHLIIQVTYLGILLTFGVVFPPLAVVMCATMVSVAWQAKLALGRYIHAAKDVSPGLVARVEAECRGAITTVKLLNCVFSTVVFCCLFYTLFLFDTLGDAVNVDDAFWVLIVMPLMPLLLYPLAWHRQRHRPWTGTGKMSITNGLELGTLAGSVANPVVDRTEDGDTETGAVTMNALRTEGYSST